MYTFNKRWGFGDAWFCIGHIVPKLSEAKLEKIAGNFSSPAMYRVLDSLKNMFVSKFIVFSNCKILEETLFD